MCLVGLTVSPPAAFPCAPCPSPGPALTIFLWLLRQKVQICLGCEFSLSRVGGLLLLLLLGWWWKKAGGIVVVWHGCPSPQASPTSRTLPRCEM